MNKEELREAAPLLLICFSLILAFLIPSVRENDVLRVGWAIINTTVLVGYLVGHYVIKEIRSIGESQT